MVGTNAVRLHLRPSYSRLHPVFNVSLVSPYEDPAQAGRVVSHSPLVDFSVSSPLRDWRHVASILDFCIRGRSRSEYLLRWVNGSPSDDSWIPLSDISRNLDPYLWEFHRRYPKLQVPKALQSSLRVPMGYQAVLNSV